MKTHSNRQIVIAAVLAGAIPPVIAYIGGWDGGRSEKSAAIALTSIILAVISAAIAAFAANLDDY